MLDSTETPKVRPIFVSIKDAARILSISPWSVYQLLNSGDIESRYHGKRRLVLLTSLESYAERLTGEAS